MRPTGVSSHISAVARAITPATVKDLTVSRRPDALSFRVVKLQFVCDLGRFASSAPAIL
jgi:hypothetical protein